MDRLILTGWGWREYACAAAVALRHFTHKADVFGMSKRRLPEFLSEVTGYQEIVILGVSLSGDPPKLLDAVSRLTKKKVRLIWVSAFDPPEAISPEFCSKIDVVVGRNGLYSTVCALYDDVDARDIHPLSEEWNPPKGIAAYHELLDAAMYYYRNYQDVKAYGNAIRHIANGDGSGQFSSEEKSMIDHYRRYGNRELIGSSGAMTALTERINRVAACGDARVLIYGESGTGKETVAFQIHSKSPRRMDAYIAFNCASVTPNLLESRFLGYEKGAFTDAKERRPGVFELANDGTLFLDEIGELPLEAQGILLRVLEGGRFTRMGGNEEVRVDVRLVTATNRNLPAMVRDGRFREDLFHRLNVVQIRVPPFREHHEDLDKIANDYWLKRHKKRLEVSQLEALRSYDYPGNVRELFNLLERASVLGETDFIRLIAEHKEMIADMYSPLQVEYPENLKAMTHIHVRRIFDQCKGNYTHAAKMLGIAINTLRVHLKESD